MPPTVHTESFIKEVEMKTETSTYVCSRVGCEIAVEADALKFCQQATKAGHEGYNPPICRSHVHDSLKREKLQRIAESREAAKRRDKASQEKRVPKSPSIIEEGNPLFTQTEAARILKISPEGILTLIAFGLISEEEGLKTGTVYVSKESCASLATLLITGGIGVAELSMLKVGDRQRLAQNLGKIFISLQNGAFS